MSGPAETTATLTRTVAVLPFTSLDSAEANELLPAGLQREIVTRLTAQRVKAALASDSPSTGEALLGSVQRAGHQVRVNVQLVHAGSRKPRWAQTYDRDVTDVLAFESEIAESVAKAIAAKKM